MLREYQICKKCIMDTSDPNIQFDENGICNYCKSMDEEAKRFVLPEEIRKEHLDKIVKDIKARSKGKKYECIIGVSGGVDSTYVAYKVTKLGLKPLAVHMDNGWDKDIAVNNTKKACKVFNIDLYTHVLDWEEFKDIQVAFLKASTPDSEIPTDHAIYPVLGKVAAKEKVEYIIDGVNFSTESIMPYAWSRGHWDWKYIKKVHEKFGKGKLKYFPHQTLLNLIYYKRIKKQKTIHILNYFDYNREEAKKILEKELGWRDYGRKHHESIYTQFYQAYILPTKFGFDKRRAHLSTLINTGQISRKEALKEMEKELYPPDLLKEHKEYVIRKLGLTRDEFEKIMTLPVKTYWDYRPNAKYTAEDIENLIFEKIMRPKNLKRLIFKKIITLKHLFEPKRDIH